MSTAAAAFWVVIGLAALIAGAEVLTRGGTRLAAHLGVPPIIIGLTIVSIGTSTPELAVGIDSALEGAGSLTVGNIAGTNVVNILLVLGLSALARSVVVETSTIRVTLPAITIAALMLMAMSWKGHLSRVDGAVLLAGAVVYTVLVIRRARRDSRSVMLEYAYEFAEGSERRPLAQLWNLTLLVAGCASVVVGSVWLVDGSVELATALGVPEGVIGLTVIAIGTSSPELVTTIIGTLHDERDIAVGNLLGSSAYNILLILGVTALVPSDGIDFDRHLVRIDIPIMTIASIALVPILLTGRRVSRREGGFMVGAYLVYLAYLLIART